MEGTVTKPNKTKQKHPNQNQTHKTPQLLQKKWYEKTKMESGKKQFDWLWRFKNNLQTIKHCKQDLYFDFWLQFNWYLFGNEHCFWGIFNILSCIIQETKNRKFRSVCKAEHCTNKNVGIWFQESHYRATGIQSKFSA